MGQSGSMSVSADKDLQWKTAAPVSQTPVGMVATETHTVEPHYSPTPHEDKPLPAGSFEMSDYDGSKRHSQKSMSAGSDDSTVKYETPMNPMNGDGQTTV